MKSDQGGAQFRIQRHDPAAAFSLGCDIAQFQGVADRAVGIQHHCPGRQGNLLRPQSRLKDKIDRFMAYFNETLAKPFQWTMRGKPLLM